jgi:uncharacterized protein
MYFPLSKQTLTIPFNRRPQSVILRTLESWLTFKPNKVDHGGLSRFNHERFFFGERNQLKLDGAFIPGTSDKIVIFIHGNRHNITRFGEHYTLYQNLGISCFTFDFPGYGRSRGSPSESGLYRSAEAAYLHVTQSLGYHHEQIILHGCSLGGAVAIELALHHTARCLITESTFTNTREMARHLYPWLPVHSLLSPKFDNQSKVGRIKIPHLIIHGDRDKQVPIDMAYRLHDLAANPKKILIVEGAEHTNAVTQGAPSILNTISAFTSNHR